ncbi:hypothetical protein GQ607_000040 [Colletotrichum asianum]|uniref:Uncharacterized protein n=1 Tax=Colletotrichum asianum TaxID=702518 RepID=A0A8H3WQY4_9PEZI|nr:hypothetical protein GQ607_000040 [Colletotrichum asianum]
MKLPQPLKENYNTPKVPFIRSSIPSSEAAAESAPIQPPSLPSKLVFHRIVSKSPIEAHPSRPSLYLRPRFPSRNKRIKATSKHARTPVEPPPQNKNTR